MSKDNNQIKRGIYEILEKDTIKKTSIGFSYLFDALCLYCEDASGNIKIVSDIYVKVAKKYETTSTRVERLIRYALSKSRLGKTFREVSQKVILRARNGLL